MAGKTILEDGLRHFGFAMMLKYLGKTLDIFWHLGVSILNVHGTLDDSLMHSTKLTSQ